LKHNHLVSLSRRVALLAVLLITGTQAAVAQFNDKSADQKALPKVPPEFEVTLFASEPLVRQPCSLVFDERGRLFIGMGPQYRNPTPETPGDSVVMVLDTDGDGRADRTKAFATGFNAIQGLAWHGRDLWVANAPDLTVVRDRDGDDEADEYLKVYTDLGNLEHGLHGLNWAPDGKLYMSKGNSKGLNEPGRYAPKPFRDLWGLTAPADVPDFPAPVKSGKSDYRRAYHHPADDWGLDGGVLRCDDGGHNLEIVARGFRNPWDIAIDSGFNWIGTDNDQTTGDRVFMPFYGAHFGWNHPWSSHWSTAPHAPTAPVSGPLFEGSGTGAVFCQSPQFPPHYRGACFINDWLLKTTYLWRPEWDGALMRPAGGRFTPFIEGGSALFRPTDLEFGPDGALWVLGWSSGYGAEWKDGQLTNEGRVFRIRWKNAPPAVEPKTIRRIDEFSIDELLADFDSPLPVRRINAQDELVRRGSGAQVPTTQVPTAQAAIHQQLLTRLTEGKLTENQETWTVWSLGRMPVVAALAAYLDNSLRSDSTASLNLRIQAVRILAHRARQYGQTDRLAECARVALRHPQPRLRLAAVLAMHEARQASLVPDLLDQLHRETDATVFYAGWQTLRVVSSTAERRELLGDSRAAVRRAALLTLLETHTATQPELSELARKDADADVRRLAESWLAKAAGGSNPEIRGRSLQIASTPLNSPAAGSKPEANSGVATVRNVKVANGAAYKVVPAGFALGTLAYVDRGYRLGAVPAELEGADLIQTANDDDHSQGDRWLSADAIVPVRVWVGIDARQNAPPSWVGKNFRRTPLTAKIDEGTTYHFHERAFDAGPIELGGNTNDGKSGGKGNYIVAVAPMPLSRNPSLATIDAALSLLERGDKERGEWLFRHSKGAGCFKCHSLDQRKNGFGPNLGGIGLRSTPRHIVQSIVEPSAVITEGFNQLTVVTDTGKIHSGVLLEESGLTLSLGQATGERIDVPKSVIEERKTISKSAMPEMATMLTSQQVADLAAFLLTNKATQPSDPASDGFHVDQQDRQLRISLRGKPIVDFVFRDDRVLRPYFANARLTNGVQVTRTHPPVSGVDALDHDTMHPGIWLGLGDVSGQDYWRNKAAMEHVRFIHAPQVVDGRLKFATECRLKTGAGDPLCLLTNEFALTERPHGWRLVWSASFHADQRAIVLGDQEEMGFGARVATPFTERNGGLLRSSTGKTTAKDTWGQPAAWCDYAGKGANSGGILLMASDQNFRPSWWHNRDYGVFVANPFGRNAMKQGSRSEVTIARGETLKLIFGAMLHDGNEFDRGAEFEAFRREKH
jgi:putative membrane-bound dehydrogenase-like protein